MGFVNFLKECIRISIMSAIGGGLIALVVMFLTAIFGSFSREGRMK